MLLKASLFSCLRSHWAFFCGSSHSETPSAEEVEMDAFDSVSSYTDNRQQAARGLGRKPGLCDFLGALNHQRLKDFNLAWDYVPGSGTRHRNRNNTLLGNKIFC